MDFYKARQRAFRAAFLGLAYLFRSQTHARIHLGVTIAVLVLGAWLGLAAWQWLILVLTIGVVLAAEAFNTALEEALDALHPAHHPGIGRAKDLSAAAVLLTVLAAIIIGLVIFGPLLWYRLTGAVS